MTDALTIERDALNTPYWQALEDGHLAYQACQACDHVWLPARAVCPLCLSRETTWRRASGRARSVSWVVYHVAYHPAFADRLPYNVTLVALEEGPRLLSNVLAPGEALTGGAALRLVIEDEAGVAVPRFRLVEEGEIESEPS